MSEATVVTPQALVFTDSAARKVKALLREEENSELYLRVFITGGGCSGFQYGFTFDETINADDMVIEKETPDEADEDSGGITITSVKLLIDPMSYQYLVGAKIYYTEDMRGAQFVIRNPNAQTTCGCGSSFSV